MIVTDLKNLMGSERDVEVSNGRSRRFLLARDGMGYTLTDTTVLAGSETLIQYKNHLEACYCIEGEGEVEDTDGNKYRITPGVMYALDKHDVHYLRGITDMRLVCIFAPGLSGHETHLSGSEGPSSY